MDLGPVVTELREQGRGVVGALLVVGVSTLYTVETWWAGWQLSSLHIVAYAVVGLAVVLAITRNVGFRDESGGGQSGSGSGQSAGGQSSSAQRGAGEGTSDGGGGQESSTDEQVQGRQGSWWAIVTDFFEILVQSFVAAYVFFLLFGLIELREPVSVVARLGLVQVVPLGFGASLANQVLTGSEGGQAPSFTTGLAVAALGATFIATPIASTGEVVILAADAGWLRLAAVVVATLVVTKLMLYELEFRGQKHRIEGVGRMSQWAETAVVYAVATTVSFGLLAMFGQLEGWNLLVWVQKTVVLVFPASIGGSAARVVL